jgi:hypothetical protein
LYQEFLEGEHAISGAFPDIVYERITVLYGILKQFLFLMFEKKIPEYGTPDNHQCADGEN